LLPKHEAHLNYAREALLCCLDLALAMSCGQMIKAVYPEKCYLGDFERIGGKRDG
jgi:hypothetical protein